MGDISIEEYEYYMKNRPHVVILGAGASCAAIPNGDKNGKRIAAMSGFIDKLGENPSFCVNLKLNSKMII